MENRSSSDIKNELIKAFSGFPQFIGLDVNAVSPWNLEISWSSPEGATFLLRDLHKGDEPLLLRFRDQLSPKSRELFCPYPWDEIGRAHV